VRVAERNGAEDRAHEAGADGERRLRLGGRGRRGRLGLHLHVGGGRGGGGAGGCDGRLGLCSGRGRGGGGRSPAGQSGLHGGVVADLHLRGLEVVQPLLQTGLGTGDGVPLLLGLVLAAAQGGGGGGQVGRRRAVVVDLLGAPA